MKVNELEEKLIKEKVPNDIYSLLKGGLPNETLCLIKRDDSVWEIYYSERGHKREIKEFKEESDACEYMFNKLIRYAVK